MPKASPSSDASHKPPEKLTDADYARLPFFDLMDQMGEDDWEDKVLYIYRKAPPHERIGGENNLAKLSMSISKDGMETSYGGGTYKLILKRGGDTLKQAFVEISGEPRWQTDREIPLTRPAPPAPPTPAAADGNALGTQIASQVVDRMGTLFERMLDRLERPQPDATPKPDAVGLNQAIQSSIQLVTEGAKQAMVMLAESMKGEKLSLKEILDVQAAAEERVYKRLEAIRTANPTAGAPASPAGQIKETLEIMKMLREQFPRTSGGGGVDWTSLANTVLPEAARLVEKFIAFRSLPGPASVPVAQRGGQTFPANFPRAQPPAEIGPAPDTPTSANPAPVEDQVTAIKRKVLRMLYEGRSGDFACEFLQMEAPPLWEQLVPIIERGRDTILLMISTDPVLSEGANHPDLQQFAQDMVDYLAAMKQEAPPAAPSNEPVN